MDSFKISLFRSERRVSTGPLYFLLMAYAFKPPSLPTAHLRLVPPWLQAPRPAPLLIVVFLVLIIVLPVLTHLFRRTRTVAKILWRGPDPAPLGPPDLVPLPGKGYTDRCFCPRRTGPWAPGIRILKKHSDVCVNRKPKTVTFPIDAALVDAEIPAWSPTPKSPWKPGRSILYDSKSRSRPAKSVTFDYFPTIHEIPGRKQVHFNEVVQVKMMEPTVTYPSWYLFPKWQNEVMAELVNGHAKRELRDIGNRDLDGDMEMGDVPRKKIRWNPEVEVRIMEPTVIYPSWNLFPIWQDEVMAELIVNRPKLRPVNQEGSAR